MTMSESHPGSIHRTARRLTAEGSEALDEAGLALVRRAAPFPPLPDDFSGPLLTLTLPLSFGLR